MTPPRRTCPQCGSPRTGPADSPLTPDPESMIPTMYNDVIHPGPIVYEDLERWRCRACGHAWTERLAPALGR